MMAFDQIVPNIVITLYHAHIFVLFTSRIFFLIIKNKGHTIITNFGGNPVLGQYKYLTLVILPIFWSSLKCICIQIQTVLCNESNLKVIHSGLHSRWRKDSLTSIISTNVREYTEQS